MLLVYYFKLSNFFLLLLGQSPLSSFHHYYPPRTSYSAKTAPMTSSSSSLGNLAPQDMSSILGLADSQSESQNQKSLLKFSIIFRDDLNIYRLLEEIIIINFQNKIKI